MQAKPRHFVIERDSPRDEYRLAIGPVFAMEAIGLASEIRRNAATAGNPNYEAFSVNVADLWRFGLASDGTRV